MKKLILLVLLLPLELLAMVNDDPWLNYFLIDKVELFEHDDEEAVAYKVGLSSGFTLDKLLLKLEGEKTKASREYEAALYYQKALSSYWQWLLGVRADYGDFSEEYVAGGIQGILPYFVETEVIVYASENLWSLRLEMEKEYLLTQRLEVIPELEFNYYSEHPYELNDKRFWRGEISLRLAYQVAREFKPFLGYKFEWYDNGLRYREEVAVLGFKAWF